MEIIIYSHGPHFSTQNCATNRGESLSFEAVYKTLLGCVLRKFGKSFSNSLVWSIPAGRLRSSNLTSAKFRNPPKCRASFCMRTVWKYLLRCWRKLTRIWRESAISMSGITPSIVGTPSSLVPRDRGLGVGEASLYPYFFIQTRNDDRLTKPTSFNPFHAVILVRTRRTR